MADSDINGLAQAQADYIDSTDELIIQKSGETSCKKIQVDDLFGGWRDMIAHLSSAKLAGVSDPSYNVITGNIRGYQFAVGNEAWITFHVDHDMKQGAIMYPHIHWTTVGTSTNTVKWELRYTMANGHSAGAFPAETLITFGPTAATGTSLTHRVTEDATGVATPLPDTLILCHIKRVTNGGTENTDPVFGLTVDWHYPTQQYATKNRTPNFYT